MRLPQLAALSLLGLCTLVGGCATLRPITTEVVQPNAVRIHLKERDRKLFKLVVQNESDRSMTVNRDGVMLRQGGVSRSRMPGGIESVYYLPPHSAHDLNVKFALDGIESGRPVLIDFSRAIYIDGVPVDVAPLEFAVD